MKKTLLVLLSTATVIFFSPAFAQSECVPTMTTDEAQVQYTVGVEMALNELSQAYSAALSEHTQTNSVAFENYKQKVTEIDVEYEIKSQQILKDLNPNWREALDAAAAKRNQRVDLAVADYLNSTNSNQSAYQQVIAMAKVKYENRLQKLTEDYNAAVCFVE
ncbi:MAG: hypothetical protein ACAH59_13035 [Pseudobdellovibrionaceae bacterium]